MPWLQGAPDPVTTGTWDTWVEVNSKQAQELGLKEGDIVSLESATGTIEALVYPSPAAPPNVLAIPFGQGHKAYGRWAQARGANAFKVLDTKTDKQSGALAWGATRVKMTATGRWRRVPKMEGSVVPRQLPHEPVIQVTKG